MKAYIIMAALAALVLIAGCGQQEIIDDTPPSPETTGDAEIDEAIQETMEDFIDENDVELEEII